MNDPKNRRVALVTTCHAAGYASYGRRMIETLDRYWPADIPLLLYGEGFATDNLPARCQLFELADTSPELMAFKARHCNNPLANGRTRRFRPRLRINPGRKSLKLDWQWGTGFRWDAVRFAHKSFAIFDAARRTDADVLIWLDADTRFFAAVEPARIEGFVPPDAFVGYLARHARSTWSETGFVAYNLRHPATAAMLADYERLYTEDLLFREREFHDAWLFDVVRRRMERLGHVSHDISNGIGLRAHHVLINSSLGEFMDHLKGGRKQEGVSRRRDLVVERPEAYWRALADQNDDKPVPGAAVADPQPVPGLLPRKPGTLPAEGPR